VRPDGLKKVNQISGRYVSKLRHSMKIKGRDRSPQGLHIFRSARGCQLDRIGSSL